MKVIAKGILCAEDALTALEHGADAIYVTNHGAR
jgi:isopentenyl diphosphate isomerase/L-lactate dehydrogenase-like FMN-dependent dehydrogenase